MIIFLLVSVGITWSMLALFSPWFNHLDDLEND